MTAFVTTPGRNIVKNIPKTTRWTLSKSFFKHISSSCNWHLPPVAVPALSTHQIFLSNGFVFNFCNETMGSEHRSLYCRILRHVSLSKQSKHKCRQTM